MAMLESIAEKLKSYTDFQELFTQAKSSFDESERSNISCRLSVNWLTFEPSGTRICIGKVY